MFPIGLSGVTFAANVGSQRERTVGILLLFPARVRTRGVIVVAINHHNLTIDKNSALNKWKSEENVSRGEKEKKLSTRRDRGDDDGGIL